MTVATPDPNPARFGALTHLRITILPQRRPARRRDVRRLRLHPDVLQYLPDISTVRDERDDAHLPTAQRAQQREHLVVRAINTAHR